MCAKQKGVCGIEGCGRLHMAKGLCSRHYYRQKRGSDPATKSIKEKSFNERFWEKVAKQGEEACWEWIGTKHKKGYGSIRNADKMEKAHRVAYEMSKGPIPKGLLVCHKCDNPGCVNPTHLFVGTNDDNMQDMVAKGRASRQRTTNILTREQAKAVYDVRYSVSATALAKEYSVAKPTIYAIWSQRNWKEFSGEQEQQCDSDISVTATT
jgi:hypothetical protein